MPEYQWGPPRSLIFWLDSYVLGTYIFWLKGLFLDMVENSGYVNFEKSLSITDFKCLTRFMLGGNNAFLWELWRSSLREREIL